MVQVHPDPPPAQATGAVAQLGERLPCTQEVRSSILLGSTNKAPAASFFNNSEICSRIVIQCNDNAGNRLPNGKPSGGRTRCVLARFRIAGSPGDETKSNGRVGLYGQAIKCIWWMPWQLKAMKDVVACDKPRGAGEQALIRGFPNGETHRFCGIHV